MRALYLDHRLKSTLECATYTLCLTCRMVVNVQLESHKVGWLGNGLQDAHLRQAGIRKRERIIAFYSAVSSRCTTFAGL
jgi:hypothetical protein